MLPRKRFISLLLALPLLVAGCGSKEPQPRAAREACEPLPSAALFAPRSEGGRDLLVPRSALVHRGALVGLYVVSDDECPVLRWVRTGRSKGGRVAVLAGLEGNERIVADPASLRMANQTENQPEGVKKQKEHEHE